ncbi:MAG: hypothetical protein ACREJU_19450, partial [Nitrospiraceae bacterium]
MVWLIFSSTPLIVGHDFHWLISELNDNTPVAIQVVLVRIIQRLFDGRNPIHLDAIHEASMDNHLLAEAFKWVWQPIVLNSEEAEKMKAAYFENQKWKARRKKNSIGPSPSEQVARLIEECESGNSAVWWQLNLVLTLDATGTQPRDELESDITKLPGWIGADAQIRARITNTAKNYLLEQDHALDWLGTSIIHRPAFAGYRAFRLLAQETPEFLSEISPAVWRTWSPIMLSFPSPGEDDKKIQQDLVNTTYRHAPSALLNCLSILIDAENQKYERIYVAKTINSCWDDRIADLLLTKAKDNSIKPGCMHSLLSILMAHDSSEARMFAESLIVIPVPLDESTRAKAIVAAQVLLSDTHDAGWTIVWPAIQNDLQFGKEVIQGVARDHPSIGMRLTEDQLADLYVWLYRHFPSPNHPSGEAHWG